MIKQNYLRFARDERLDLKGEFYGNRGKRLIEQPAVATFRFYISSIQTTDTVIPKGSRIRYNELYFETDKEYKITKGNLSVDGKATCNKVGTIGNNYGIYASGTVTNTGNIDFKNGLGNVGIYSTYGGTATNNATISVGESDATNSIYSIPIKSVSLNSGIIRLKNQSKSVTP